MSQIESYAKQSTASGVEVINFTSQTICSVTSHLNADGVEKELTHSMLMKVIASE